MGLSFFKTCYTNTTCTTAPNPNPSRWKIIDKIHYKYATLLIVQYLDCTNFEGTKIMVYAGEVNPSLGQELDPHFSELGISPIARFKPTTEGINLAKRFAQNFN